jgi:hypothetical protein
MQKLKGILLGILALTLSQSIFAQPTPAPTPTPKPTPGFQEGISGLRVEQAFTVSFNKGTQTGNYYQRITYKGKPVSQQGTTPKYIDPTNQFLATSDTTTTADANKFQLNFITGNGALKQETFNANGLNTFSLRPLNLPKTLDPITRLSGTLDGKQLNFAMGIEGPSQHPINGVANWIRFGANIERQWRDKSVGKSLTSGLVTARGFLGKANWEKTRVMTFSLQDLNKYIGDITKLEPYIRQDEEPNTGNIDIDSLISDIATRKPDAEGNVKFNGVVLWNFKNNTVTFPNQISNVYTQFLQYKYDSFQKGFAYKSDSMTWVEGDAWYRFAGTKNENTRGLIAIVSTKYIPLSREQRSFIQFRYEYGYDRAAPTTLLNRLSLGAGLNF